MAGLFGFYDVTREGPGVSKNAPQKRSFVVFFEIYGRKFWSLLVAGLLWLVVSLPLVTRGWADAGLTFITRNYSRQKHAFLKEDFFETIKRRRGQALLCGIINLLVTGVMVFSLSYYAVRLWPNQVWTLLTLTPQTGIPSMTLGMMDTLSIGCTLLCFTLFTWMKYYLPFMMVTFQLKTSQLYKNAFLFAVVALWRNLLISAILIAIYGVLLGTILLIPSPLTVVLVLMLWALLVPAFRSLLIQYVIFPEIKRLMIDPYYKENPNADKQARIDLNLEVEEAPATPDTPVKEEPVFSDETPAAPERSNIPKQYSEREMRRFNRQVQSKDDDDDTI